MVGWVYCEMCHACGYRRGKSLGANYLVWRQVQDWHRRIEQDMRDERRIIRARDAAAAGQLAPVREVRAGGLPQATYHGHANEAGCDILGKE